MFVTFTLTSPGCPIGPQVSEQIEEFVGELDGVDDVYPKMTFTPPWTPDLMSEEAKFALGLPSPLALSSALCGLPIGSLERSRRDGWDPWTHTRFDVDEERKLAGKLAGVLFLTAGLTVGCIVCCSCRGSRADTRPWVVALWPAPAWRGRSSASPFARPQQHGALVLAPAGGALA